MTNGASFLHAHRNRPRDLATTMTRPSPRTIRLMYEWARVALELNALVAHVRTRAERELGEELVAQGEPDIAIRLAVERAHDRSIKIPSVLLEEARRNCDPRQWPSFAGTAA